jgi:endogenous inhibitor of DNA gyrase (YacG/DUF329 family)
MIQNQAPSGAVIWRKKYVRNCQYCGQEFHPAHNHTKFCSWKCGAAGRTGPTRKNQITVPCANCGATLSRNAKKAKVFPRHFCSLRCKSEFQRSQFSGKDNPNFKDAATRICAGCGKKYHSYCKTRKYCGTFCAQKLARSKAMASVRSGFLAEKQCCKYLTSLGYHCSLSAGSRGHYDVIAINGFLILLIQVKTTNCRYRIFPKTAVQKLREAACPFSYNIKKQLWCLFDGRWHVKDVE